MSVLIRCDETSEAAWSRWCVSLRSVSRSISSPTGPHDVLDSHGSLAVPGPDHRLPGVDPHNDHNWPQRVAAVVRGRCVRHQLGRGLGRYLEGVFLHTRPFRDRVLSEPQHVRLFCSSGDPRGSGADDAGDDQRPGRKHHRRSGHEDGLLHSGGSKEHPAGLHTDRDSVSVHGVVLLGAAGVEHELCAHQQHHRLSSWVSPPCGSCQAAGRHSHRRGHLCLHPDAHQRPAVPLLQVCPAHSEVRGPQEHQQPAPWPLDSNSHATEVKWSQPGQWQSCILQWRSLTMKKTCNFRSNLIDSKSLFSSSSPKGKEETDNAIKSHLNHSAARSHLIIVALLFILFFCDCRNTTKSLWHNQINGQLISMCTISLQTHWVV